MEVRTFGDLIDWTRQLHEHLARCLSHCADHNEEERAKVAAECEKALIQAFGEHYKDLAGQVGITPYQLIAGPLQKKESEDV